MPIKVTGMTMHGFALKFLAAALIVSVLSACIIGGVIPLPAGSSSDREKSKT